MKQIVSVRGFTPDIPSDCFIADNARIIGDVRMGHECSIWYNAVVRGDVNSIVIGNKVNIQDGAVIHCTYEKSATYIGNNVSVGHQAMLHGCTIKDNVLVGMGGDYHGQCHRRRKCSNRSRCGSVRKRSP